MYIALEGIDLVGKTTQIELLKSRFLNAVFTREPGGTSFGTQIREILLNGDKKLADMTEFLLFLADRSEHYEKVIKPALNWSKLIISDRSVFSGIAYGLESAKISRDFIINSNLAVIENKFPDLVVVFEISRADLLDRLKARSPDKIEQRGIEYALSIQKRLISLPREFGVNMLIIDASSKENDIFRKIERAIIDRKIGV